MEHFLIPWSFLRVRSDNIRYPLNRALLGIGLPPFPRFLRTSQFLAAYTSLAANARLDCPGHYSLHVGYYGDSVAIQGSAFVSSPGTGNPAFLCRRRCDAFRFPIS